jgi:hypothetical protein
MIDKSQNASSSASLSDYIREVEKSRIQALVTRNMELLWQLHAPDYQLITPSGRSFSRERYLREIESGSLRYLRWEPGPMEVRASEQMAIVRYQATLELDSGNGEGTPFLCWHMDSYEPKDEVWQAVWSQATAIR